MKRAVMLSIQGRQSYDGQDPETIELVTEGTLEYRDGVWEIVYEESALTGLEGVTTTFRVEPNKITLDRRGALSSRMVFQKDLAQESLYQVPFGALLVTVQATRVFYDIVPDGGTIDLVYNIAIENTQSGVIDYHLDIRAKE